ncbi:L,D-transpeptidase family protein [Amaricoccus macauensis]|uniref:L,D-transpeptidase family protein n=1 Tax=Amaricoccus macauensis TaxID=57001 RepID=UPI003C7D3A71
MTNQTWFNEGTKSPARDETSEARSLWTRRSALALTAGFLASGATAGQARVFTQTPQPRVNHIVISKRNRVMALMSGERTLKRYKVHLGFAPQGHKSQSGDGRTPEGRYFINRRNPRSDFHLSLGISYPNAQDVARALAMGVDPGGDIFIHGGPRRREDMRRKDWTAGCIAVSDKEIEEIWSMTPTGIPVTILA